MSIGNTNKFTRKSSRNIAAQRRKFTLQGSRSFEFLHRFRAISKSSSLSEARAAIQAQPKQNGEKMAVTQEALRGLGGEGATRERCPGHFAFEASRPLAPSHLRYHDARPGALERARIKLFNNVLGVSYLKGSREWWPVKVAKRQAAVRDRSGCPLLAATNEIAKASSGLEPATRRRETHSFRSPSSGLSGRRACYSLKFMFKR